MDSFFLSSLTRDWVSCAGRQILFYWLLFMAFAWAFSRSGEGGGYCLLPCVGFSLQWLLLLQSTGSRHVGFSSCSMWAQYLCHTGLVDPRHVASSQTRDRTHVSCIDRQILILWATREVFQCPFSPGFAWCCILSFSEIAAHSRWAKHRGKRSDTGGIDLALNSESKIPNYSMTLVKSPNLFSPQLYHLWIKIFELNYL